MDVEPLDDDDAALPVEACSDDDDDAAVPVEACSDDDDDDAISVEACSDDSDIEPSPVPHEQPSPATLVHAGSSVLKNDAKNVL